MEAYRERLLCFLILLGLPGLGVASAVTSVTVPPRTVAYESVIPDLTFRTSTYPRIETNLIVINSESHPVLLEMELSFADGNSATEFFDQRDPNPPEPGYSTWAGQDLMMLSEETGKFYREIRPHSLLDIDFPGERNPLVGQDFSGWVLLRANRPVTVFQKVRVRSPDSSLPAVSEINQTASLGPTRAGRLFAGASRGEIVRVGEGHVGWITRKTGIALTNPNPAETRVRLALRNSSSLRVLAPYSKETFLIDQLFTFLSGSGGEGLEELRLSTEEGSGFAAAAVEVAYSTDLRGRPAVFETGPPIWLEEAREFRMPRESGFDFPEEILRQIELGENRITLTRFGFALRSLDRSQPDRVFPYNLGGDTTQAGIGVTDESDLAVVHGSSASGFGFVFRSGKVEIVPYSDCCTESPRFERLEADRVRVFLGHPCSRQILVVDTNLEMILSSEVTRDPGAFCF